MTGTFISRILDYRYTVVLLTIVTALALGYGSSKLVFTNDYRVFFGPDNPQLQAFENLQDRYTKTDNLLYMLEPKDGNVITPETLAAIDELTREAWQLPYSIRVDSIINYQHTYASGDELTVEDLVSDPRNLSEDDLQNIRTIALNEPLLVNKLISPDAHVTGVNVIIQLPGLNPTEEPLKVIHPARELMQKIKTEYPHLNVYLSGVVMMNNAFPEASQQDAKTLLPMALLAITLGLLIFLRSFSATLITIFITLLSVIMAMGTAGWLGYKLTPPSATAPIMILTLAVADCVHLLVSCIHLMQNGLPRAQAIKESMRINFHPVFLTSLTTVIGFLTLNFSDVPPFQDLGNITAMGISYAFILAVTFLPACLAIIPFRIRPAEHANYIVMSSIAEFVIQHRHKLLWGMSAFILFSSGFLFKNQLNDNFVKYFDKSIEFRQHTDYITENLTGMYFIDYSLDSKNLNAISSPDFLRKVDRFAEWYRQQPEVLHVLSYTTIMKRLNKNMHADDPAMYRLPEDRALAAQYLLLYEMSLPYGLDLNNQIDINKSAIRFSVSLKTLTSNEMLALEQRAATWLQNNASELLTQGASPALMFSHIGQRNIESMLTGTMVALLLISLTLIIALRSFKYGLLSLLPNLLPAFVSFGIWGIFVSQIGLSLSVVASMTLGIVVDDTIHFFSKYLRARRERNLNASDAVRYAFNSVGQALAITTLVLMAGFLVLAFSAFELNSGMGLLTAITIAIALIIDFLFIPPLLIILEETGNENTADRVTGQPAV